MLLGSEPKWNGPQSAKAQGTNPRSKLMENIHCLSGPVKWLYFRKWCDPQGCPWKSKQNGRDCVRFQKRNNSYSMSLGKWEKRMFFSWTLFPCFLLTSVIFVLRRLSCLCVCRHMWFLPLAWMSTTYSKALCLGNMIWTCSLVILKSRTQWATDICESLLVFGVCVMPFYYLAQVSQCGLK